MTSIPAGVTGGSASLSFDLRGVIEGFYGPVWSMEQRLDLIRFVARHHMNFYGYAPKGDPLCRRDWDRPLVSADLSELAELTSAALRVGVSVAYGLSPGISICYSCQQDRDRLIAKFDQLAGVGVRYFMLLFDDLPPELQHSTDRRAYEALVDAQADLANLVYAHLDRQRPKSSLAVCPTVYCGRGDEPYIRRLGERLDRRVEIFWTGRTVWASEIDSRDAQHFNDQVGRQPLYWDNYPANDLFMSSELHLGPYRGRDANLHHFARGVLVNPMKQMEASKIPLATIADYLFAPTSYDAEASWKRAFEEVGGTRDARAWRLFADNVRSSCLEVAESPLLTAALEKVRFAARFGSANTERTAAIDLLEDFAAAASQLLSPDVENVALADEVRPWLLAFEAETKGLLEALSAGRIPAGRSQESLRVFSSLALNDLLPDALPMTAR